MPRQFYYALIEGTIYTLVGLLIVFLWAYFGGAFESDWVVSEFARRWDGTCSGWTRPINWIHLIGNVTHWWSYCTIAFVFWRLHPPLRTVPYSQITILTVGWFIIGCGVGHLIQIMTTFHPMYRTEGWWLVGNGVVSVVATVFVAFSLTRAFEVVTARRRQVEKDISSLRAQVKNLEGGKSAK